MTLTSNHFYAFIRARHANFKGWVIEPGPSQDMGILHKMLKRRGAPVPESVKGQEVRALPMPEDHLSSPASV